MPGELFRRLNRILKSEGIVGIFQRLGHRLLRRPAFHRDFILISHLDLPVSSLPVLPSGVEFRRLLPDDPDLGALVDFDEWHWIPSETHLRAFLNNGQNCFAAYMNGKPAAYLWTKGSDFDNGTQRYLEMGADELYFFAAYTLPAFRGRGLIPGLLERGVHDAHERLGKKQGVALIHPDNQSSLKTFSKSGWRPVGSLGYLEVFGLRLHYILSRQAVFKSTRRFQLRLM